MKKRIQITFCLVAITYMLFCANVLAQNITINGYIRDASNGEDLIGATIRISETNLGTITNLYGFYSLTIPVDTYELSISYVGYETITIQKAFSANETITLELAPQATQLEDVVVTAEAQNSNVVENQMSVVKLEPETIRKIPSVLGEPDVIRSIQLLPGITSVADGSAGFNVRGGSADQNLILLDEGIIYNSAHLLGFYSVINPDAIKDIKIYKGGIPANYGGRLSSVLDVRQREGNSKKITGETGIGFISAHGLIEGPIVKDKSSFMVAARRSYGDAILRLTGNNNTAYFYDLNVKTNYTFSDKDRMFISGYFGRDKFELGSIFSNTWGNATGTVRWNHVFSDKLFANISGIYSNYDYSIDQLTTGAEFNKKSNVITYNLKGDFDYFVNNANQIKFGADNKWYEFVPGEISPLEGSSIADFSLDRKYGQELGLYLSHEIIIGQLSLNTGLRYSRFIRQGAQNIPIYENNEPIVYNSIVGRYEDGLVIGAETRSSGDIIKTFSNFEPRVSATLVLNSRNSVKASYNRINQYLHLISNSNSPTPLDIWAPSGPFIKPQQVDQVVLGYFRNFKENMYEASIEVYYKDMNNLVDYVDGANLLTTNTVETEILPGKGRSYGLELYLVKKHGALTGWISYSLSRSERQVKGLSNSDPGINNGNWYAANFDKTHDLSISSSYKLNDRISFSGNFIFAIGTPTTYPKGKYEYAGLIVPHFESRNDERLPSYHRLDLSMTIKGRIKPARKTRHEWVIGFYNIYNRTNASSIYFAEDPDLSGRPAAYQSYLFGITPSLTYTLKF